MRLNYEDLSADPTAATRDVLAYLGLELPRGTVVRRMYARQSDDVNEAWIRRFRSGS